MKIYRGARAVTGQTAGAPSSRGVCIGVSENELAQSGRWSRPTDSRRSPLRDSARLTAQEAKQHVKRGAHPVLELYEQVMQCRG